MSKRASHKWTYEEQLFCIEYAIKHYKNRDFKMICKEVAEHINSNMSQDNNPTTASSIQLAYNHIVPYLKGEEDGFGSGSKGFQDATDEAMEKHNLSKVKMEIIFG